MPKHPKNIRREAAKIVAGKQAVNDAVEKMQRGDSTAGVFWRVVRSLGFKSFILADHNGTEVRGTAGHGGGKVIVTIGCIVLTSCPMPRVDGVEILAVIDSLKEAKRLVRLGVLHPSFIGEHAQSTTDAFEEAFVFAPSDDAVLGVLRESQPRSLKESRAEEVAQRSIERRVRHLMRGGGGGGGGGSSSSAVNLERESDPDEENSTDDDNDVSLEALGGATLPTPAVGATQARADQPAARVVVAKPTPAEEAKAEAVWQAQMQVRIENDVSAW